MSHQPQWQSAAEAVTNNVAGFVIAVGAQEVVLPFFGFYPSLSDNMEITAIFMLISLIRSYFFRRLFDWFQSWWQRRRGMHVPGSRARNLSPFL